MISLQIKEVMRGEIYWINLDPAMGTEIKKTRPAIIISNDIQNKISSRIIVIPITSSIKKIFSFESQIIVEGKEAKALTDQIRAIDKSRIGNYISKVTKLEMHKIELALKITLSLE